MENDFTNLGFNGPPYTQCSNRKGVHKILSIIDRGFATLPWLDIFGKTSVLHLARGVSDHALVLISIINSIKN